MRKLRERRKEDDPEPVALVAERAGRVVGYCHRLKYWSGLESELFLAEFDRPLAVALIRALARSVTDAGDKQQRFAVSECRVDLLALLPAVPFEHPALDRW